MALIALAGWALTPFAHAEVNSDVFGFTEGTNVGAAGDRGLELASEATIGKRTGSYRAIGAAVDVQYNVAEGVQISAGLDVGHLHVRGLQQLGYPDASSAAFRGLHAQAQYQLLHHDSAPLGLMVSLSPHWSRRDAGSGLRADVRGLDVLLSVDRELVPDRWYGALNLIYGGETVRLHGADRRQDFSTLELSAALSRRIDAQVSLGLELRYARAHDGLWFDDGIGHALFLGPTAYIELSDAAALVAAWGIQVAGRRFGFAERLDLDDFERHRLGLKLTYQF